MDLAVLSTSARFVGIALVAFVALGSCPRSSENLATAKELFVQRGATAVSAIADEVLVGTSDGRVLKVSRSNTQRREEIFSSPTARVVDVKSRGNEIFVAVVRRHKLQLVTLSHDGVERLVFEATVLDDAHVGGEIAVGIDDLVYLAIGDSQPNGDQQLVSQDYGSFLGKILAFRVSPGSNAYEIPAKNPFSGLSGGKAEIYSMGVRDPLMLLGDGLGGLWVSDLRPLESSNEGLFWFHLTEPANLGWPESSDRSVPALVPFARVSIMDSKRCESAFVLPPEPRLLAVGYLGCQGEAAALNEAVDVEKLTDSRMLVLDSKGTVSESSYR